MRKLFFVLLAVLLFSSALAAEERIAPAYPVPDYVTRVLEIAGGEVGYTEYDRGTTKYGIWAGDPRAQWCAEYLCWSVAEADRLDGTSLLNSVWPRYSGSNTGRAWFLREGRFISRNGNVSEWGYQWLKGASAFLQVGEYIPQPGDWVFFTWNSNTDTDHVAMVEYCTRDAKGAVQIHVLEGNNPNKVQRAVYALTYRRILGFGTVHDVMDITMRYNCAGAKVLALQEKLAYLGYLTEKAPSGTYGQYTSAAVRAFQTDNGLKVTGIASMETQIMLDEKYQEKTNGDPSFWVVIADEEDEEWPD